MSINLFIDVVAVAVAAISFKFFQVRRKILHWTREIVPCFESSFDFLREYWLLLGNEFYGCVPITSEWWK